jgi:polysaccharide biosynthesis protein PslG
MATPKPRRARLRQTAFSLAATLACTGAAATASPFPAVAQPVAHAAGEPVAHLASGPVAHLASGPVAHAAARPVAHAARGPVARASRSALRAALAERAAAGHALAHARKRLRACRRAHPRRCRAAHRAVRRARRRLARARRRVKRMRARIALARRSTGARRSSAAAPTVVHSGDFGEPFVKGVVSNLQGWGPQAVPKIASEMGSLGVNWAREDLSWADSEPQPGVFDWSSFDEMVAAAQANGITVLPIVGYAPSWTSPTDASAYAAFVKAAVERYGPGTQANLRWWELWNEPYFSYAWAGKTPEPAAYARDVVAAAEAAKGASPAVKLLVAADYADGAQIGSSQWETAWVDDMFGAEPTLGHWIDGVSVHPYGDDPALPVAQPGGFRDAFGGWSFQRIDTVRSKFLAHGVDVPFWITETGWSTAQVSEATQAVDYEHLVPQVASRPWVRALFPYCLREFDASGGKESEYGLLKYGSWEPKAAFYALQKGLSALR